MFADAVEKAHKYTHPVIYSKRLLSGQIISGCAAFIVVNPEGFILTAAHIIGEIEIFHGHQRELQEYEAKKQAIINDQRLNPKQKRKQIARLEHNSEWIINQALFWGWPDCKLANVRVDHLADLAIGKLETFDHNWVSEFPVFKNPATAMKSGTSLCRLGFPFHKIEATFDEATKQFTLSDGVLPVPFFPNDGIFTRTVIRPSDDRTREAKFIETSTPGLRGQSGGPIFDRNGHIWAIQSRTQHLRLGFTPVVKQGNRETVEHQFMHVGWGSHVEDAIRLMRDHGISFALSP